jgi:ribosomal-protein-alanine N-acetyltransferase
MNAEFTRLGPGDIAAICELEQCCFSLPWSAAQFEAVFTQTSFFAVGLRIANNLIAYISFYHAASEMEILNIAVKPEYRRLGHGTRILSLALRIAENLGINRVTLEVRASNLAALALYRNQNFMPVGKRPRYYADTGEDAIILEGRCPTP